MLFLAALCLTACAFALSQVQYWSNAVSCVGLLICMPTMVPVFSVVVGVSMLVAMAPQARLSAGAIDVLGLMPSWTDSSKHDGMRGIHLGLFISMHVKSSPIGQQAPAVCTGARASLLLGPVLIG